MNFDTMRGCLRLAGVTERELSGDRMQEVVPKLVELLAPQAGERGEPLLNWAQENISPATVWEMLNRQAAEVKRLREALEQIANYHGMNGRAVSIAREGLAGATSAVKEGQK